MNSRPSDHDRTQALPITEGNLIDFSNDPIACMRRLHSAHGDVAALQEGAQRIVFVFGPEGNQRVLSDARRFHSRFFAVRGPRRSAQRRLTCGLLSMNGQEHREHRRLVMGPFQKKTLETYEQAIHQLTEEMLADWQPGEVRDMDREMTQYMLRLTSAILFGLDQPELAYKIGAMIDRWVHLNHETGMGAFLSDRTFTQNYDRLLALADELEADIRTMIDDRRLTDKSRRQACDGPASDVLSLLIRAHDQESRVDDDELIGHVALLFGAAHLTTAHTFTWTLFLLAQHPEIMRQLDREFQSQESEDGSQDHNKKAPMTVLERVIKESMRILPASAYSQRIAKEPVELGPLHVKRETPVIFSQFMTHHRADLYPEPETFRPDRWLEINPSPYSYLPFGAGPRMCLGGPLALFILKTALPMILKRYRLTVVADSEINGRVISTMLGPTTEVPMRIDKQDGRFEHQPVRGNIHELVHLPHCQPKSDHHRRAA